MTKNSHSYEFELLKATKPRLSFDGAIPLDELQLMCPRSVGEVKSAAIKTWILKKLTGETVRILHYM